MASGLLFSMRMKLAAMAALAMLVSACQPITVEPDAGPPVNHPPVLLGPESPSSVLVDAYQFTDGCQNAAPLPFNVGTVEDDDIDQDVQERWIIDLDPNNPTLGETLTLSQDPSQPAFRNDSSHAFVITSSTLQNLFSSSSAPHTVDVFISDGFDYFPADGGTVRPDAVLPGSFLLRHSWVLYMSQGCTP